MTHFPDNITVSPDTGQSGFWRLLLVDDHPIFRKGLVQIINSEPDLQVCGEVSSATEALAAVREKKCGAIVIDISLPGTNGIELTKQLRAEHPDLPILVVSMYGESTYALRALRAGANGYIMKREGMAPFLSALRTVLSGETYLSPAFSEQLIYRVSQGEPAGGSPLDILSDREMEVLHLVGEGQSTQEIAAALDLNVKTIETHRLHIKEKLGIKGTSELVRFALDWFEQQTG